MCVFCGLEGVAESRHESLAAKVLSQSQNPPTAGGRLRLFGPPTHWGLGGQIIPTISNAGSAFDDRWHGHWAGLILYFFQLPARSSVFALFSRLPLPQERRPFRTPQVYSSSAEPSVSSSGSTAITSTTVLSSGASSSPSTWRAGGTTATAAIASSPSRRCSRTPVAGRD